MNASAYDSATRLKLSGMTFDRCGLRRRRFGRILFKWENLIGVAVEEATLKRKLTRTLVLTFFGGLAFELPIRSGLKEAIRLESVLSILRNVANSRVQFSGDERLRGIRARYESIADCDQDGDDHLIERARVWLDVLELKRAKRNCNKLIRRASKWEQEAHRLKVRALLYEGRFRAAEREIRLLEERFPNETEARIDYALASLSCGRRSGPSYARKLLEEDEKTFADVGVQLSYYLISHKRYENALDIMNTLKRKISHEDRHLSRAIVDMENEISNFRDFKRYVLGNSIFKNLCGQLALIAVLSFLIVRFSTPAIIATPDLIKQSERILELEAVGQRATSIVIDANLVDEGFGLRRMKFSYIDPAFISLGKNVWKRGESLVFSSEAARILNQASMQFVTYDPYRSDVSEIGPISYRRVIAIWFASWEKLRGAVSLVVSWLGVCVYYLIRRHDLA